MYTVALGRGSKNLIPLLLREKGLGVALSLPKGDEGVQGA